MNPSFRQHKKGPHPAYVYVKAKLEAIYLTRSQTRSLASATIYMSSYLDKLKAIYSV